MKVLVCGSRSWTDGMEILCRLRTLGPDVTVIHGGALGADKLAGECARDLGLTVKEMKPRKGEWPTIRNTRMLNENPDLVMAFWDGQSRGTADTIRKAKERGIRLWIVRGGAQ